MLTGVMQDSRTASGPRHDLRGSPGLLHPALQMHVSARLFELQARGAALVPTQALREMQGAVAGHATCGRKAGGAFGVAQSMTF